MARTKVFISYSHKDEDWKDQLSTQLCVLERQGLLELWCDRDIEGGREWEEEINRSLLSAKIAVLVISPTSSRRNS
jgi:TIR domain